MLHILAATCPKTHAQLTPREYGRTKKNWKKALSARGCWMVVYFYRRARFSRRFFRDFSMWKKMWKNDIISGGKGSGECGLGIESVSAQLNNNTTRQDRWDKETTRPKQTRQLARDHQTKATTYTNPTRFVPLRNGFYSFRAPTF